LRRRREPDSQSGCTSSFQVASSDEEEAGAEVISLVRASAS